MKKNQESKSIENKSINSEFRINVIGHCWSTKYTQQNPILLTLIYDNILSLSILHFLIRRTFLHILISSSTPSFSSFFK